eukprot:CAMPEP_0203939324 /NCGR_PEP_ID=MMETSP0359-20131031/76141_1 /ASSEMBLY_ACC=CAM_ASM_000338 /TAXON_ID=268821 /ORGANISM="Scrippsiella Hangoei, Strain SHTV-5" /LENGTH=474 /DNA_ID=CAMNT_0050869631 /DNA_START=53 /DNA_END=1477 /DNA_ORIENTATION=-
MRQRAPESSPGRGILSACFAEISDSEHEAASGSDTDLTGPGQPSSLQRVVTYDPYGEVEQPVALTRSKTYDPYDDEDGDDVVPAVSSASRPQGSGSQPQSQPQSQPHGMQMVQVGMQLGGTQQPSTGTLQSSSGDMSSGMVAMPQQQWAMGNGGMMMAGAPFPPGAVSVQMMPMQMMAAGPGGQPIQMQGGMMPAGGLPMHMQGGMMSAGGQPMQMTAPAGGLPMHMQGGMMSPGGQPMQMMCVAMPTGYQAGGMPAAGMQAGGMPAGMPGGAVAMVPANYMGNPAQGFMQGTAPIPGQMLPSPTGPLSGRPGGFIGSQPPSPSRQSGQAQPQTVTSSLEADGIYRVRWTVDARKLKGNDKTVVSPSFEIPSKASGTFKMMINPTPTKMKGGATFRNSSGRGSVQLKCDTASESRLAIRFTIGDRGYEEQPRGPLEHNFALNGVCGLPKDMAEWDFTAVVDEVSKTFVVCLELL